MNSETQRFMRILIYGINFAPELIGIGKYTSEMARWLIKNNHDVRIVTAPPYYPDWKIHEEYNAREYTKEIWNGLTIWRSPLWVPAKPNGIKRLIHLASFAIFSFPLLFKQVTWRPDIIWIVAPAIFCAPGALMIAKAFRIPIIVHIQDFEIDAAINLGLLKLRFLVKLIFKIEKWILNGFDKVSTISDRMKNLIEIKGVDSAKLFIFRNWVDTKLIFPNYDNNNLRKELGVCPEETLALYSGNIGKKQGLDIIINAAKIILERNIQLKFVICGRGAEYNRLRLKSIGLKNIIWVATQPTERLNELLNMADIHLLPQLSDVADLVMPSKLTGILASGRPVVATAINGTELADAVKNNGILVLPNDDKGFASAILRLANDPVLRDTLGRNARDFALKYLDSETVLKDFERQLRELVPLNN